jgi:Tol biopolymer transport system component
LLNCIRTKTIHYQQRSDFSHHSPDYSEKHKRFAYVSNESGYYELWSANTKGEARKQLTQLKKNISYPSWSHDGSHIAFLASGEDNKHDNIYIYSLQTQKVSIVQSPFQRHNRPTWSLDDKNIISAIYSDEFTDIFGISIEDGKTERLTFDSGRYGIMNSASTMLYTKPRRGLWQIDLSNKDTPPVKIIDGKQFTSLYAWDYHQGKVYFNKRHSDHHAVMLFDIDTNESKPMFKLPLTSFYRSNVINYIADQDSLIYTRSSYPQADIKVLENSPLLE